ncbi:SGNH/GDSL hydrolase family protein [Burkholderia stagnalis]|uniref:SGNH/GDSL hydrolase family protein n=1 Tax=Burkholderia stagnalis TaxID=1503054 RepID=A0ABX9YTL5_9BURK|nr:SGNH/GDSL hydrolase family protein [Burkholderia stagnalis]RQQ64348.1 SGNH/GDSL hydrolase family protein [Burkholderia stagnalis]RQR14768.1 SGNH/GDSL hydrolase family protein [Burkholderia stagnalis]RQR15227.1 SGNH/GDSL hydrolase family protein [Burkholderia stagnalis]RQR25181.1 SGNH/GDSL hydrolase family protein [Burkholderia stagnalis]RQY96418.1 SGNH/GDSL hydrolase family protein [Burkholderia stagnalis]
MSTNFSKFLGRIAMKGAFVSLLGALVVSCSGCGGGGGSDSGTTPTAAQASAPRTVLIESYGDSTTQGWQVVNGTGQVTPNAAPVVLQKLLQDRFGTTVTVSNNGVGSTEASQLLNGTDGAHPTWQNQMAASKAQIITLNFGLNDAYYTVAKKDGIAAESPSDFASVMTQLVQIARDSGKQVIIFEPNPTCESIRQPLMPSYVDALRQVATAQQVMITNEFDAIASMPDWQSMLTDCLHPSDVLYQKKAEIEFPAVASAVEALLK